MNNNNREKVYLAALLHDIGKFYQRADAHGVGKSEMLSNEIKKLESTYCPMSKHGYRTHKHVLYTAQFFDEIYQHLANILSLSNDNRYTGSESVLRLAAAHHNPNTENVNELIIQKADHYSSGMDRTSNESFKDADAEHKWDDFKRTTMRSIFESIGKDGADYEYRLGINALGFSKKVMPAHEVDRGVEGYAALWQSFKSEFKFLQTHSIPAFADSVLYLLHKYTLHIPSSTINLPDVSLYDHLKTTGAFALCLHDYYTAHKQFPKPDEKPFLLIGADITGIQKYLYSIVSSNASKNLKGRSYYLQLLIDSVSERLLNDLALYGANLIYASGGGFYLLAPNTQQVKTTLAAFEQELSLKTFEQHGLQLGVVLDAVAFGEKEIFGQNLGTQVWQPLSAKLNTKKRTLLANELKGNYSMFFEPFGIGAMAQRDDITGEEFSKNEQASNYDGLKVKPLTQQQIELGKALKDVDYHIISTKPISYWNKGTTQINVLDLGIYHYFINKEQLQQHRENLKSSADNVKVLAINSENFLENTINGIENIYGFELYGGNKPPTNNNVALTFDELAKGDSLNRLGVLRMDIDNLGQVFINGLEPNKRSFSRYATLSRNLDFFFKGYLNSIWQQSEVYRQSVFIIYSGGDDLFVVGKWNVLLDFALEVNEAFKTFTCKNQMLSLSGGMALVTSKFPIMKAAELAEVAEKMAKDHKTPIYGQNNVKAIAEKNSLTLLNHPLNFEHELPIVLHLKKEIKALYEEGGLPMAFGAKVANYAYAETESKKPENKVNKYQWRWLMAYDFARMADRNKAAREFLEDIKNSVFTNTHNKQKLNSQYQYIELLNIANRLAQLELRT